MAITQINPVTNSLSDTITAQNKVYKTQADITLSEFDSTAAPQVQAGSIFANNGTLFENDADATPTGYAGISSSTAFYLYYDESGGVFIYAETAPVWSDDKQGWYNGNDRAFFSMFKDAGDTLYENKGVMAPKSSTPSLNSIGSITLAGSTSWSVSTEYLPGSTVVGNTLVYDSTESGSNNSFGARAATNMEILVAAETNLSYTGTWVLLSRVWRDSDSTVRPIGLFQRIA